MADLNDKIERLAADFAKSLMVAVRSASLAELMDLPATGKTTAKRSGKTRQWPKCPVCGKNAWPWGKGYCHEHAKAGGAKAGGAKAKAAAAAKPAKRGRPKGAKAK